jgi:uncharacterized membrane protein
METSKGYKLVPGYRSSFGTGWKVMKDNFLRLFLVVIIAGILVTPIKILNINFDLADFPGIPDYMKGNWEHFIGLASLGIFAAFIGFLAFIYAFLVAPVFEFGYNLIFVRAVRRIKPEFELLIKGFMENYLHIILANLLVIALVILGLFALIVPGIIIACRLAFVAYIVMDKKLDPIEAVELSWKMTKGHGWKIFFMGVTSFFIIISGLIIFIVGIFPAIIWISGSFAALYEAVLREESRSEDQNVS